MVVSKCKITCIVLFCLIKSHFSKNQTNNQTLFRCNLDQFINCMLVYN